MKSYKKGAASFYIVAIATLILVVLAVGFATAVIGEIGRTSNADLSQSAYDAALAGVEDAKVAFINYKNCKVSGQTASSSTPSGGEVSCADIIYWVEHPDCDMVGHILGRIGKNESKEVLVSETTNGDSQMNQAYTCVEFDTNLFSYKASVGSSNSYKVVKVDASAEDTNRIRVVKLSWYKRDTSSQEKLSFNSWEQMGGNSKIGVAFKPAKSINAAVPPIVSFSYIQTAPTFKMDDFTKTGGESGSGYTADRGTVFLVPTDNEGYAMPTEGDGSYIGTYDILKNGSTERANVVRNNQMVTTSSANESNKPYAVYCNPNSSSEYLCEAYLEIPDPYNSSNHERNNQTFMFVVGVPYGQPDTAFSIELFGRSGDSGIEDAKYAALTGGIENVNERINMGYSQVNIDSTGRANDLYRRVEARVEPTDPSFAYLYYGIQLLGNDGTSFGKDMTVTCEPSAGTCSDQ